MNYLNVSAAILATTVLTACGGAETSPGQSDYQRLLDRTNAYDAQIERITAMNVTSNANVANATGTAQFKGAGAIFVNPTIIGSQIAYADATLLGDANLNVNFDNNTMSGSVTNIYGSDNNNNIDEYTGSVQVTNGHIGGTVSNTLTADYAGTVRGNNDNITMNGSMDGQFLGNPSPRAIDLFGYGSSQMGAYNGSSYLAITAERN